MNLPTRPLTHFEQAYANQVVLDGVQNGWEYAAFMESSSGPLIAYSTSKAPQYVIPPHSVHSALSAGIPIVIHHNHLSQESLSCDDWNGLANGIAESFAHCADGTVYWGSVVDKVEVLRLCLTQKTQMNADTAWANVVNPYLPNNPLVSWVTGFFGKEELNRAMHLRGFVNYGYLWGAKQISPYQTVYGPTGLTGQNFDHLIDQAAIQFAPTL